MERTAGSTQSTDGLRIFEEDRVSEAMAEVYRMKTPAERLRIAFDMWRAARRLVQAGIRHQHPEWTAEEVDRETARRMCDGPA